MLKCLRLAERGPQGSQGRLSRPKAASRQLGRPEAVSSANIVLRRVAARLLLAVCVEAAADQAGEADPRHIVSWQRPGGEQQAGMVATGSSVSGLEGVSEWTLSSMDTAMWTAAYNRYNQQVLSV